MGERKIVKVSPGQELITTWRHRRPRALLGDCGEPAIMMGMSDSIPQRRWLRPTPGRLVLGLLVVEGLLFLSERFHWFAFNEHKGWTVLIAVASVSLAMLLMLLWFAASLLFRWRFQFSIRSLLVLTLVVAMPCSWLSWEMKRAKHQTEVAEAIRNMHQWAEYDWEIDADGAPRQTPQPPATAWLRSRLGVDFFAEVVRVNISGEDTDMNAWPEQLEGLTELRALDLSDTQVADGGLEHLKNLTQLRCLDLGNTKITDAGLENIKGLKELRQLGLYSTGVTDLRHLEGLTKLSELFLNNTKVTDAGLEQINDLTELRTLDLSYSLVTDAGLQRLRGLTQLEDVGAR